MDKIRKPFQGIRNIIRFNWHFYVLAIISIVVLFLIRDSFNTTLRIASDILALLVIGSTLVSLMVSYYVYDFSELYKLSWLDNFQSKDGGRALNIHAGFDETSSLLSNKFPNSELSVFDFYDPARHTEVSIRRARKAYPSYPGTVQVKTNHLPLQDNSTDEVFAILSAHEIRNDHERDAFFRELRRALAEKGHIIVTEHLRDTANFLAYNIGFFHFHSRATWLKTFRNAGLRIAGEIKITPFITTFILDKNGTTP